MRALGAGCSSLSGSIDVLGAVDSEVEGDAVAADPTLGLLGAVDGFGLSSYGEIGLKMGRPKLS